MQSLAATSSSTLSRITLVCAYVRAYVRVMHAQALAHNANIMQTALMLGFPFDWKFMKRHCEEAYAHAVHDISRMISA